MVEVRWLDAVEGQASDWVEHGRVRNEPMPSRSVGYLVAKDRKAITLALLANDNHTGLHLTIPRRMVTSMHELRRR